MNEILKRAKELNPEMVSHRRYFHQNPELGLELPKTSAYVWEKLTEMGYEPERIGKSSIVATVGKGEKTFLIRADMDALPIQEATGVEYCSQTAGCMHACGHDCHTAMLLGAAKILKEQESQLKGQIRIFFQAGEEILDGAKEAVEAGLLENPHVDAAMMIHIMSNIPIEEGSLCFPTDGGCYASADWYRVDVTGKGGHGAMPHMTVSSINTLCAINAGIQEIMSVVVIPSANAVMTVGEMHAGDVGSGNVIPASAYLAGTIRTFQEDVRVTIKESLEKMVINTALARGASASVSYSHSAPVGLHDPEMRQFAMQTLKEAFGEGVVVDMKKIFGGAHDKASASEDFAYIAQEVPSAILFLAAGTPENGYNVPGHNPRSNFNEDVFYIGAAAYATVAAEWLAKFGK